jgi:ACS family D-galactonate transporter-like MFS transporter
MFGFFVLIMIINYIDRASLSIALPLISKEFNITPVIEGLLLSSFGWTYTIMQLPGGWLVDKLKPRRIVTASLIGWGIVEGLTGLATGVAALFGARMILGVFEAPVQNGANTSLTRWLRRSERGRGSTLVDGGGPLGTALGGVLVTALIIGLGTWRLAFGVVGLITVAIGVVAWLFMRDNPATHPLMNDKEREYLSVVETEENPVASRPLRDYFRSRSMWLLLAAFFGYDAIIFGLLTWAPTYVSQEQHVSFAVTGVLTFVIFGSGFLGEVFAGQFADRVIRRGAKPNTVMRWMLLIAGIGVVIAILLVNTVTTVTAAIVLISVANFFLRWGGLFWSVPARIAAPGDVGKITGAMNFSGNIAGIITPILIGIIFQQTSSFAGVFVMFAIAGALMAVAAVGIHYGASKEAEVEVEKELTPQA